MTDERASAIIISKRHILLIHRVRVQKGIPRDYYVFPGGGIEKGESAAEACAREVAEETGLQTAWMEPAFDFSAAGRLAHFFFVAVHPGVLSVGGPEALKRTEHDRYLLEWIPLVKLGEIDLRPNAVRDALAAAAVEGTLVREAQELAQRRARIEELLEQGA